MLKFCSLYSGSSGNSLLVQSANTNVLVDAGVSGKKIVEALDSFSIDISSISAILVTHEHIDHVRSLGTLSKKYDIPVFANKETWSAMPKEKAKISEKNQIFFSIDEPFSIGDLEFLAFSTPHDAANSCGFNIFNSNTKISIATDLGHVTPEIMKSLEHSKFVLLESNYDPEVLRCSSYPYPLKARIDGPNGHLSNYFAGEVLSNLMDSGLQAAMLGHLSKENNFPELAYKTVVEQLEKHHIKESSINLSVASRFEPSNFVEVS